MSLVDNYKNYPVTGRYGQGYYSYCCVLDTNETGVVKIEIFADFLEEAIEIAQNQFGAIYDWSYISQDIISLILAPYSSGTCLLYMI